MPFLQNLSSQSTASGNPWEFVPVEPIPEEVRKDKKARDQWICTPTTNHCVYSLVVGVNSLGRVSRGNAKGEDGNPPRELLGFCADYDCPTSQQALGEGLKHLGPRFQPNYIERTLSGNWRLLWLFDKPLLVPSYDFLKGFLEFSMGKIRFDLVAARLDTGAFLAPERYYTNSCDWHSLSESRLPITLIQGWVIEYSAKHGWKNEAPACGVSLADVAVELAKRYPRFSEWPGEFADGSQGPSFWIDGSTSPKSAIVRETGIQSFADHATKPFYFWADLLGSQFLDTAKAVNLGAAVDNIFFDGRSYFRQIPSGVYRPFAREDLSQHLKVTRKLSPKPDKNGVSQIDSALQHIQDHNNVVGAAPFAFRPHGRFFLNCEPILNTHSKRVMSPAPGPVTWGDAGQFPWLSKFLGGFFDPPEQLQYFIAWLSRFYSSSHALDPRSGQNIFIAGDQNTGKTLLSRRVVGGLMNGSVEAADFLLGGDTFGSELFESAVWTIDDGSAATDSVKHKRFSEAVKRMAANQTFKYHAKFRVPLMVQWQGRVIVTCNRDEESIRMLPDLSLTLLDKISLFRGASIAAVRFPDQGELDRILERELPFFARYLLDYQIPECLVSPDERFGVLPYHDETLISTANQSSRSAVLTEILSDWKHTYFGMNKAATHWTGTAFQFHKMLLSDPGTAQAMKSVTGDALARGLVALKTKGDRSIDCHQEADVRMFVIKRDAETEVKPETVPVATVGTSRFTK